MTPFVEEHINYLEQALKQVGCASKIRFASYCLLRLWEIGSRELEQRSPNNFKKIMELAETCQAKLANDFKLTALESYRAFEPDDVWLHLEATGAIAAYNEFVAIEIIECALRLRGALENNPRDTAEAAERVINVIDFEIGHIVGATRSHDHPKMTDEIANQKGT